MIGAHHKKMATFIMNASNSPGKVLANTSPLKKLRLTASQPGALGTNRTTVSTTANVDPAAMAMDRRRKRCS
jgi:hypothetical protein